MGNSLTTQCSETNLRTDYDDDDLPRQQHPPFRRRQFHFDDEFEFPDFSRGDRPIADIHAHSYPEPASPTHSRHYSQSQVHQGYPPLDTSTLPPDPGLRTPPSAPLRRHPDHP